jgi:uncharacterized protein YkwD
MPSSQHALIRRALILFTALSLVVTGVVGTLVVSASDASAGSSFAPRLSSYDQRLANDINRARERAGRAPLQLVAGTTDVAHGWSCTMAWHRQLSHRPNLAWALTRHGSPSWRHLGENVGVATSTDPGLLFRAYMRSAGHRANILNARYHYLGIRTIHAGGRMWNTLDFVDEYRYAYGATRQDC